jgi:hypothetical protein
MLKQQREELSSATQEFESEVQRKWGKAVNEEKRIKLNVGGQIFETSPSTLARDRFSLLAAIVTQPPAVTSQPVPAASSAGAPESKAEEGHTDDDATPQESASSPIPVFPPAPAVSGGGGSHFAADAGGTVFIDRDWWRFRHILAFLRHGSLPSNLPLLRQLYI